jgi:hypothetical protein
MFAAGLLSIGASGGSKTSVEGLVHTGEQHQRQCKMLNPVLDVVHLRRLGIPQTRLDFYQSNPRTWGQVPSLRGIGGEIRLKTGCGSQKRGPVLLLETK